MAISEHKNGHFEEIRGWLQILELGSNSTIFYLLFDTNDSPGAIFIWKWEIYRTHLLLWKRSKNQRMNEKEQRMNEKEQKP